MGNPNRKSASAPTQVVFALLLLTAISAPAQKKASAAAADAKSSPVPAQLADWTKLIDANKCEAAHQLCDEYVHAPQIGQQAEAQKCLANAALCGHAIVMLQAADNGGGTLSGGYTADAVDNSLAHLDDALNLAPQDISIHQGRLHVLEISGRYDAMVKALDESCSIYKGSDVPDAWLAYAPELQDLGQYQAGAAFMRVLNKYYPNNPDILGNVGAFLSLEGKDADAIPYLQQAVKLSPGDPINTWDLAREYDYAGQVKLADQWYRTALPLQIDTKQRSEEECLYASFTEQKLHDPARACALQRQYCGPGKQTACAPPAKSAPHPSATNGPS